MSFAPLLSPESPSYTFVKSSISSLAALCSSILAATTAWIDDLAPQIPPSWCLACKLNNRRHSHVHVQTQAERTGPPSSDCSTASYTLKKLKDTDGEPTTIAIVFNPRTKTYSLKKLKDIDVEKAIFRDSLPSSAASVKVQLPGATKLLGEVLLLGTETPRRTTRRRLNHQPSLVDGIFIIPGSNRTGSRSTAMTTTMRKSTYTKPESGHQQLLPVELPASPYGSVKRKYHPHPPYPPHQLPQSPIELPAEEIATLPVLPPPRAVLAPPTPPRLMVPRPRSRRSRMASPLLALPSPPSPAAAAAAGGALLGLEHLGRKASSAGSVGSESIQIAYVPSH